MTGVGGRSWLVRRLAPTERWSLWWLEVLELKARAAALCWGACGRTRVEEPLTILGSRGEGRGAGLTGCGPLAPRWLYVIAMGSSLAKAGQQASQLAGRSSQ
mmetsp:Transcript_41537/g.92997  ORF Transcript_41537/g.92997 Transcript_41537/m.92997 type:complete len:102 (+) Transcript_41537:1-306(+)